MMKNLKGNEVPVKSAIEVARSIFNKKFDVTDVTIKLDVLHITQQDGYNCGAFICYYANQIVKGIYTTDLLSIYSSTSTARKLKTIIVYILLV